MSTLSFKLPTMLLVMSIATTSASGCYHAVARGGTRGPGEEQIRTGWNLFWGIMDANFDIADCPTGLAYAEVWRPWWGFIPEFITFGIASPQRLAYVCSAPPGPQYAPQPQYPPRPY